MSSKPSYFERFSSSTQLLIGICCLFFYLIWPLHAAYYTYYSQGFGIVVAIISGIISVILLPLGLIGFASFRCWIRQSR